MIETQSQTCHMTVDIHLCGNLTRRDVGDNLCRRSIFHELSSQEKKLNSFSVDISSKSIDFSVFRDTALLRKDTNSSSILLEQTTCFPEKPLSPPSSIPEPPIWAEPAKGEARLEVSDYVKYSKHCSLGSIQSNLILYSLLTASL